MSLPPPRLSLDYLIIPCHCSVIAVFFIVLGFWELIDIRIDYGTRNIDSEFSFRLPLLLQLLPATLLAIGTSFLPFSPRWLASQGPSRSQETLQVLSKLRNLPATNPALLREYHEIKVEVELQKGMETRWREMMSGRIRRRTMIGVGVMFFQQFSGINALLYYAYPSHIVLSFFLSLPSFLCVCISSPSWSLSE